MKNIIIAPVLFIILISSMFACSKNSRDDLLFDVLNLPFEVIVHSEIKRSGDYQNTFIPENEYLFNFLSVNDRGVIYTFDQHSKRMISFSNDFRVEYSGGAAGRGPGEFDLEYSPVGHSLCPNGSVLAHDINKPELIRFSAELEVVEVMELNEPAWKVICTESNGFLYLKRFSNRFIIADEEGKGIRRFSVDKDFENQYSAMKFVNLVDDYLIIAYPVKNRLIKIDLDGNVLHDVKYPVLPGNPQIPVTVTTRALSVSESLIALIVNTEELPVIHIFDHDLEYRHTYKPDYMVNDIHMVSDNQWLLITHGNRSIQKIELTNNEHS